MNNPRGAPPPVPLPRQEHLGAGGEDRPQARHKTSLRRRLVISMVASAALAVLLTTLLAAGLFRLNSTRQAESELRRQAAAIGRQVTNRAEGPGPIGAGGAGQGGQTEVPLQPRPGASSQPNMGRPQPGPGGGGAGASQSQGPAVPPQVLLAESRLDAVSIWQVTEGGQWQSVRSAGEKSFDPLFVQGLKFKADGSTSGVYHSKGRQRLVFAAQKVPSGGNEYIVLVGRESRIGDALIGGPRFLLAAAIAVAISLLLALWLARRIDRPLTEMAAATNAMSRGDFSHRVTVPRERELAQLAASVNAMGEQVSTARAREKGLLMNVSHDLRTPLTAIRGYGEALVDNALPDEEARRNAAEVIVAESGRLERLVHDLLDIARLDAGEFALNFSAVSLGEVISDISEAWKQKAEGMGVDLSIDVSADGEVVTDGDRVAQIVGNLLDNAIRHTPEGGKVVASLIGAETGAFIRVSDSGSGIAESDLPHIWDRLYVGRGDSSSKTGTGLGLTIVHQLVTALGGSVDVWSKQGSGTSFTIWLPDRAPGASE